MNSIKLKKLSMKNFRSYKDSEVLFSDNGLVLIRGKNLDTGGSSYSGKSSIPLAIAYALGFCPFSSKEQTNWNSKSKEVALSFSKDDVSYEIIRSDKAAKLSFGSEEISGAKVVDEKLAEIFGVSLEIVKHLTYKQQKTSSYFLSIPDSEKKDFLAEVLGLSRIEKIIELAATKNKEIEIELDKINAIIENQQSMLGSLALLEPTLVDVSKYESQITNIDEQILDIQESVLEKKFALSSEKKKKSVIENELLDKIEKFKSEWRNEWDTLNNDLLLVSTKDNALRDEFNKQKNSLQNTYKECLKRTAKLPQTIESIEKNKREIETLRQNRCPTCKQEYMDVSVLIDQKNKEVIALQDQLLVLKEIDNKTEEIEQELKLLKEFQPNPKIREISDKINNLELQLKNKNLEIQNEYQDNLRGIEISINSKEFEIRNAENLTKSLNNEISTARETVKFSLQENSRRQEEYIVARQELEKTQNSLLANSERKNTIQAEFDLNREVQDFLGKKGFLGSIFDEILAELNSEVNKILKSVANTSHVTFEFVSENVTTKGDVKKQIKPMLTINGYTASLYSGASGGMISAIELAIDLSIMNIVSRRSNSNPGWIILDESFDGMDVVSKETCLNILQKNSHDKMVLVIDHATEIKESFSAFIDVEYKNGISRVL